MNSNAGVTNNASDDPPRPDPDCPQCRGLGSVRQEVPLGHANFGKLAPCPVCMSGPLAGWKSRQTISAMMNTSGLSADEYNGSLDDILERGEGSREMIATAKEIVAGRRYFLTLWGGSGNGKTRALVIMVGHFLRRGESAIYSRLSNLLNHLRDGYNPDDNFRTSDRYRQIVECRFLAIDEPEKVKLTDWAREVWFNVVDDRYLAAKRRERATAIAMNDDPETLPAYVLSRLRYDLHSDTGFAIVHNTDPDGRESGL